MGELKTGARLRSTVCDGEVMVVAAPSGDLALTCGGAPMVVPLAATSALLSSEARTLREYVRTSMSRSMSVQRMCSRSLPE